MALRKIIIAVDCADDEQRDRVQRIMNEVSGMRFLEGDKIEGMYPYFRNHQGDLYRLFTMITNNGVKSLMSGQGITLITKLARR